MENERLKTWPVSVVREKIDALFWQERARCTDRIEEVVVFEEMVTMLAFEHAGIDNPDSFSELLP